MSDYVLVTTFNESGYKQYGQKMLDTFLTFWPATQKMIVYNENADINTTFSNNPRLIIRDLNQVENLQKFKERNKDKPEANGFWPKDNSVRDFKYDAVRFSHKVYALYDAFKNLPDDMKSMVWLDADTVTLQNVPEGFLDRVAPRNFFTPDGKKQYGITYLGRIKQHSECGFVAYNVRHPLMDSFWEVFITLYDSDELLNLKEWHDSYVFDYVRTIFEKRGMINNNLTPRIVNGHPFINCILGEYMDHMKGNRKVAGRSRKTERFIRSENDPGWWR